MSLSPTGLPEHTARSQGPGRSGFPAAGLAAGIGVVLHPLLSPRPAAAGRQHERRSRSAVFPLVLSKPVTTTGTRKLFGRF